MHVWIIEFISKSYHKKKQIQIKIRRFQTKSENTYKLYEKLEPELWNWMLWRKNVIIKICFFLETKSQRKHSNSIGFWHFFLFQLCWCIYLFAKWMLDTHTNINVAFMLKSSCHKYSLLLCITTVFHNNPYWYLTDDIYSW